jgi:hypothetical protein
MPAAKPSAAPASAPRDAADQDTEHLRAGIQSVEVGFELLNALSQAPGALMLRDLAAAAGMSAAKAHRYLVSFQRMGLVAQDPLSTRYDLGPAALRLGLASLSRLDAVSSSRATASRRCWPRPATRWRLPSGATRARPWCTGPRRHRPCPSPCAWAT